MGGGARPYWIRFPNLQGDRTGGALKGNSTEGLSAFHGCLTANGTCLTQWGEVGEVFST